MGRVLLVRHGQASFGADDYDVLSAVGEQQAAVLGRFLADRGVVADALRHGALVRQRRTAEILATAAGWSVPRETDRRWDEIDADAVLARHPADEDFQTWLENAVTRWQGGGFDAEYPETWAAFTARVDTALDDAVRHDGTVVVVTSGGPVGHVAASLLQAGFPTYQRLARVVANASVTQVVSGGRGTNLISFNEHTHLPPDLLTYR